MNRQAKIIGGMIFTLLVLYVGSTYLDNSGFQDLVILAGVLSGIGVVSVIIKESKIKQRLDSYNKKNKGGVKYDIDQCKNIAKEWAKNNYRGKIKSNRGMSFDWTHASSDAIPVYDFSTQEWIQVRYFYTQYGPKDKGTLIFVDATNGRVKSPQPVKEKNIIGNEPFEKLAMYRQTKRFFGRIPYGDEKDDAQNIPAVTGIPVQNFGGGEE